MEQLYALNWRKKEFLGKRTIDYASQAWSHALKRMGFFETLCHAASSTANKAHRAVAHCRARRGQTHLVGFRYVSTHL